MVVRCGWKFCHEGNCQASQGLPSDAETVTLSDGIFSLHQENIMDSFSCTVAFKLEYALLILCQNIVSLCFTTEKLVCCVFTGRKV